MDSDNMKTSETDMSQAHAPSSEASSPRGKRARLNQTSVKTVWAKHFSRRTAAAESRRRAAFARLVDPVLTADELAEKHEGKSIVDLIWDELERDGLDLPNVSRKASRKAA